MSALPTGEPGSEILVPHWLTAEHRGQLADTVRDALAACLVHPVAAIHLEDVLTELHVAAAVPGSPTRTLDREAAGSPERCHVVDIGSAGPRSTRMEHISRVAMLSVAHCEATGA